MSCLQHAGDLVPSPESVTPFLPVDTPVSGLNGVQVMPKTHMQQAPRPAFISKVTRHQGRESSGGICVSSTASRDRGGGGEPSGMSGAGFGVPCLRQLVAVGGDPGTCLQSRDGSVGPKIPARNSTSHASSYSVACCENILIINESF